MISSSKQGVEDRATTITRSRYDRIALIYDLMPMQFMVGQMSRPWREKMWQMVGSSKVIEIGVGTGINIELWPPNAQITAIDLSPGMLKQAHKSVPDPVQGLREVGWVVRPGGTILLLEHTLSPNPFLAAIMNIANPIAVQMMGANINRRTLDNIRAAELYIESVENMDTAHIFKSVLARSN